MLGPVVRVAVTGRTDLDLADERLDDDRIELGARDATQLGDGLGVAERRPVRARRGHGLVRVGDGDDLRGEGDLVALEEPS